MMSRWTKERLRCGWLGVLLGRRRWLEHSHQERLGGLEGAQYQRLHLQDLTVSMIRKFETEKLT
jgi:hypothetical protein